MRGWFNSVLSASLGAFGVVALSGPVLADHELGHDAVARGGILALEQRIYDLEQIILSLPVAPAPALVDCGNGESIQTALDGGATDITVVGACNENVVISQDGVTLNGGGTASITGDGISSAINVAADHVVITDWASVEGGTSPGVRVGGAGSASISNMASITGFRGVLVHESGFAEVIDSSLSNGPGDGLIVTEGGHAKVQGSSFSGNDVRGIVIANAGSVELGSDNHIDANDAEGILILHGSLIMARMGTNNTVSGNGVVFPRDDVRCFNYSRIFVGSSLANTDGTSLRVDCALGGIGLPLFATP